MSYDSDTVPAESSSTHTGSLDTPPNVEIVARDRYAIGDEIAQGGIGRILRASDKRLERQVALKELLDPSPEHEARFLREALVTAKLQHPAIVPVYDVGRFPDGEIFYAMKLVSGRSLGEVVDEARTLDKRLALLPHVIAVAEAIAYAHSEHIVHRDLKPANVLIGPFGETVVIDWGIAKDLREIEAVKAATTSPVHSDKAPDSTSSLTMAGAVLGTPGYMPPEQAAGDPVDERADVYALGAILYHVLAGVAPYEGKNAMEVLAKVLTEPPLPLSARERGVPRDLLAIVSKAMARDPAERYPTANEFAHDLRRFQTGQIVGAYNYSRRERAFKFVQRHRGVVAAALFGLAITSVVGFTSLSRVLAARRVAEVERDRANEERARAQQKQSEAEAAQWETMQQSDELMLIQARAAARHDPNEAIAWLSTLCGAFNRWGEARLIAADAQAYGIAKVLRGHTGPLNTAEYSPDGSMIATCSDDRTVRTWSAETGELLRTFSGHTDEVWRTVFTRDGKRLMSGSKDGTVRIWDIDTGKTVHVVRTTGQALYWNQYLGDENHIALLSCASKRIEIHDLTTGSVDRLPGEVDCPGMFTVSADYKYVAYTADGTLRVMNLETRQHRDFQNERGRCSFAFISPDSKYVACAGTGLYTSLWDINGKQLEYHPPDIRPDYGTAAFSKDSKYFAFGVGHALHVRNLERESTRVFHDHRGTIFTLWPSDDGQWIATASHDRTVVVRNLETEIARTHYGFLDSTYFVAFSPNRQEAVATSWDHTARVFPIVASRDRILSRDSAPLVVARFAARGDAVMSIAQNGNLRIEPMDPKLGKTTTTVLDGERFTMSFDGTMVAHADKNGTIFVRSLDDSSNVREFAAHDGPVAWLRFSPKGDRLVSVGADDTVRLWDVASGQGQLIFTAKQGVKSFAISPDASNVAIGDRQGGLQVISVNGGPERSLVGHVGDVNVVLFLPDGKRLVSGGKDHTVRIWDLATGKARTIDASGVGIINVIASSDGKTLYSLGSEPAIRRWEVETGKALPILRGHDAMVLNIALSPDNTRLLSGDVDGSLRLWDLASGQSRSLEGHKGVIRAFVFSPKGDKLVSAGTDGTVRIWYDDLPHDGDGLRAWMSHVIPSHMKTPIMGGH
ncbi:MAG: serine/threonine protein kinase [Polyangiaceae bacterium]|nr:serine/threonine protein kinase [Polyangiaceae bacterium]